MARRHLAAAVVAVAAQGGIAPTLRFGEQRRHLEMRRKVRTAQRGPAALGRADQRLQAVARNGHAERGRAIRRDCCESRRLRRHGMPPKLPLETIYFSDRYQGADPGVMRDWLEQMQAG